LISIERLEEEEEEAEAEEMIEKRKETRRLS
jgi:hypothetical protein